MKEEASFINLINGEIEICKFGFLNSNLELILVMSEKDVLFFVRPLVFYKKTKLKNVIKLQKYFLDFLKENVFDLARFFFEKVVIPMPYTILIFKKKKWSLFLKELLFKNILIDPMNVANVYKITIKYLCI